LLDSPALKEQKRNKSRVIFPKEHT
jgi:hypothetical protein